MITNKPSHEGVEGGFQTKFAGTKGGSPSNSIEAFLNMPLSDKLAVRVAAYNDRAGGWIDNELGAYTTDIDVVNRNQISPSAHICTGDVAIDSAVSGNNNCGGVRATVQSADNSGFGGRRL